MNNFENEKRAKVITFANQKGGVSKTTSCQMMAYGLSAEGNKVLTVDTDASRNLTAALAFEKLQAAESANVFDVMAKVKPVKECILHITDNLDLLPGSEVMAAADMKFTMPGREYLLKEGLAPVISEYDYILIDTPPTLGIICLNALVCANSVIIPTWATKFSILGFKLLMETIGTVRNYYNQFLRIEGVLITQYSSRGELQTLIKGELGKMLGHLDVHIFDSSIRTGTAIQRAQNDGVNPFLEKDRKYTQSGAIKDYKGFVNEFKKREKERGI